MCLFIFLILFQHPVPKRHKHRPCRWEIDKREDDYEQDVVNHRKLMVTDIPRIDRKPRRNVKEKPTDIR